MYIFRIYQIRTRKTQINYFMWSMPRRRKKLRWNEEPLKGQKPIQKHIKAYRGKAIVLTVGRICFRLLRNLLEKHLSDKEESRSLSGLWAGRSTSDNIFTLKLVLKVEQWSSYIQLWDKIQKLAVRLTFVRAVQL